MKYLNPLYLTIIGVGVALYFLQDTHRSSIISFYGYAENKETEINFNFPVQVKKIYIQPGQVLKKGDPMLDIARVENKLTVEDQQLEIVTLQAEKQAFRSKIEGQIELLGQEKEKVLADILTQKKELVTEQDFSNSLYEGLESIARDETENQLYKLQLEAIQKEWQKTNDIYSQKITNKKVELEKGVKPFDMEMNRLRFEISENQKNASVDIQMTAQKDGLVGNIYCKENEHFSSYKTLVSTYEPNPSTIKGFIQEDFIMKIALDDRIYVRSTKDEELRYTGTVIGLGSRIVEIPPRLRKREDFKTYGREIIVSIPPQNQFLQKERTILELINGVDHAND